MEIVGRLAGASVTEIRNGWRSVLDEGSARKITLDISGLTGCDTSGIRLLREMHAHGTYIAARNATALEFLNEISSPEPAGPTLVYKGEDEVKRKTEGKASVTPFPHSKAAGGGR